MKVLLVGLERVGKLFSMESLFKKKLTEAFQNFRVRIKGD
jgi:hypothetical protein